MRQVQDTYEGYEAGTRPLQWVQGGYETPTRGTKQVQDTYKGHEASMRHLQGV